MKIMIFIINIIMFTTNVYAHPKVQGNPNFLNSQALKYQNSNHVNPRLQKYYNSRKLSRKLLSPQDSIKVNRNLNLSKHLTQNHKNRNGTELAKKAVAKEFAVIFKQILFNAARAEKDESSYEGGFGEAVYNDQYNAELFNKSQNDSKLGQIAEMVYKQMK